MAKIMLKLREAVELTGMSYYALRKLCLSGQVYSVRAGTKILINRGSLLNYLGEDPKQDPGEDNYGKTD